MYEEFFGLREQPFGLTPDPRFLVPADSHAEALRSLRHGIASRTGVMLLLGDAGLGKTTTIRAAIDLQPSRVHCCHLSNPTLTRAEFNETFARAFGLSTRAHSSTASMLLELEALLTNRHSRGETTVLVVDEAQSMPGQLLEEVQFLADLEVEGKPLVSIVLAGQYELAERLNEPPLRELPQRAGLRCELRPLTLQGTRKYIAGRIEVAGGTAGPIFTDEALRLIHEAARGVPRTINVIADNALLGSFVAGRAQVDADIVRKVCRDFILETAPENEGPYAEELPEYTPVVVPPTTRSAKGRVFGYVAGLVLLLAAVTIGAGIMAPVVTQRAELADSAGPIDAAETPRPRVDPVDVTPIPATPADVTPIDATPIDVPAPVAGVPAPVAEVRTPVDIPARVAQARTPVDSEPPARPPAVPAGAAAANTNRTTTPPPVARQVQTVAPPEVPDQSRRSNVGAVASARGGGRGEPPVSPTVTTPLSQSSNAPRPPSPGARPRLPSADEPPLAVADNRVAGAEPGPPPPTPATTSTPAPAPAPEAPETVESAETAEIQSVIARYRHALETLSTSGIETVWPTVDSGNLQRAFDQLSEQSIEFDKCTIDLTTTSRAAASCSGRASIIRKVGGGDLRSEARQWTFHLSRANEGWTIDRVESR